MRRISRTVLPESGPIRGVASVVGSRVLTSSSGTPHATGVDVHGREPDLRVDTVGGYSPVVSDGRGLFVVGYEELVGFVLV